MPLGSHPRWVEVVVIGNYLVCTMIYEVTHILDTQLFPTTTPSKPVRPPKE